VSRRIWPVAEGLFDVERLIAPLTPVLLVPVAIRILPLVPLPVEAPEVRATFPPVATAPPAVNEILAPLGVGAVAEPAMRMMEPAVPLLAVPVFRYMEPELALLAVERAIAPLLLLPPAPLVMLTAPPG
jgi:hypothetical protein